VLVTVQGDTVATDQPVGKLRLALAEQFEVKIPDPLNPANPVVRALFVRHYALQIDCRRISDRLLDGACNPLRHSQQIAAQHLNQFVDCANVPLGRRGVARTELTLFERAQRRRVAVDVDRLRPQQRQHGCCEPRVPRR
jgi:hypothetical protein